MLIFWTMKNWRIKYVRMETNLKKKELLFGPTVLRECFFNIFKWPFKKQRKIRIYGSFLLKNCISILQENIRRKLRGLLWCIKIGIHCNDYDEEKKKNFIKTLTDYIMVKDMKAVVPVWGWSLLKFQYDWTRPHPVPLTLSPTLCIIKLL